MLLRRLGYDISLIIDKDKLVDIPEDDIIIMKQCRNYTLTNSERMYALMESVRHIVKNNISGDIIECGVWKGGSMMLVAKMLLKLNNTDYDLYLYDTFEGTTKPSEYDKDYTGKLMLNDWDSKFKNNSKQASADYVSLEQVKKNIYSTGYPKEKIHFIKGDVKDTLNNQIHNKISLLRLDTDWYESTRIELETLYPKLTQNGILIIDDYGHFQGSKKAVDEYFKGMVFLNRIDYTGRLVIKP